MHRDSTFLLLGGAGLVGQQVARRIATDLSPRKIVIAALFEDELRRALDGPEGLRAMFGGREIEWVGEAGDVFVREEFRHRRRRDLLVDEHSREALHEDLFGSLDSAYGRSTLAGLIRQHRPDVIVDSINTATAISYQDVHVGAQLARRDVLSLVGELRSGSSELASLADRAEASFEALSVSLSTPQLIRHVLILQRAMREAGTRIYLKIGTTGTGGMGMNIPYTHSEDKPSTTLLTKSAIAFAHTGLMFLMARTTGGPIVKEVKPGAMIGYADVVQRKIRERGDDVNRYASRIAAVGDELVLHDDPDAYEHLGELTLPVVDTGENGLFTRGEFEAITTVRQMEFITPEEIALDVVLELEGSNTGRDVIAAIDGAVMSPTYRAGVLRQQAIDDLARLEKETGSYSVALGQLGPPELSKLLWEAQLLKLEYQTLSRVLEHKPEEIAEACWRRVRDDQDLRSTIASIGLPILSPDGKEMIRGPRLRIPERPGEDRIAMSPEDLHLWARKGWVDLRMENFLSWQSRFASMVEARQKVHMRGSAAMTIEAYRYDEIRIGDVVGWIFNNEIEGYRIK